MVTRRTGSTRKTRSRRRNIQTGYSFIAGTFNTTLYIYNGKIKTLKHGYNLDSSEFTQSKNNKRFTFHIITCVVYRLEFIMILTVWQTSWHLRNLNHFRNNIGALKWIKARSLKNSIRTHIALFAFPAGFTDALTVHGITSSVSTVTGLLAVLAETTICAFCKREFMRYINRPQQRSIQTELNTSEIIRHIRKKDFLLCLF